MEFNRNLKFGDKVLARWTNCGYQMQGTGVVTKINAKSARVVLSESVPMGEWTYPVGQEIRLPIITGNGRMSADWTWNNGVFAREVK